MPLVFASHPMVFRVSCQPLGQWRWRLGSDLRANEYILCIIQVMHPIGRSSFSGFMVKATDRCKQARSKFLILILVYNILVEKH
jgi:hypothetical protein